jgi:anti-sigma factor RsiW
MRGGRHGKRGRPGTCREVIALLSDYLDGGLLPGVTADLARHLEGCAACARFFDSLKTARAAVVRLRFDRIPEEVHQRLRAFLRAGGRVV